MWISLNDGFLSVVADQNDPLRLLIRARRQNDLADFVGTDVQLDYTPNADYAWRTFISTWIMHTIGAPGAGPS